jgi:hypothetical protein
MKPILASGLCPPALGCPQLIREQMHSFQGAHLLFNRIRTVSRPYLKPPLEMSVERRADSLS